MKGFQVKLRRQIARFSLLFSLSCFLLFMAMLLLYSVYFNSYRAKNYNRILAEEFRQVYEQYDRYASESGTGYDNFLRCLSGDLSGTALSFVYRSFARDCIVPSNLVLTDSGGQVVSTTYPNLSYSQRTFNAQVVQNMLAQGQRPYQTVYFFDGEPRYVLCRPVYDGANQLKGVASLYIDTNVLTQNMRTLQYSGIIVHGNSAVVVAPDRELLQSLNHFYGIENGKFRFNGQDYWMYASQLPGYNVTVYAYVGIIPIWGYYLLCTVFSVIVYFLVTLLAMQTANNIAQHSAASVERLRSEIDSVAQKGDGTILMKTDDEFEDIADHINMMLDGIRELTSLNFELLKLNNAMEMRTLEAKFNPHFLYNTLESIRFAIQLKVPGADNTLLNLTKLLRYSVGNCNSEVSLSEDLSHILSYLDIIKFRFGERFTYHIDIDPSCMSHRVPKLLLQPVIENSVKYGFQSRKSIAIAVRGVMEPNDVLALTVTDDGGGILLERLTQLRGLLHTPAHLREGAAYSELQSTARRLYLQYGGSSRIEINSTHGEGTEVTLYVEGRRNSDELPGFSGRG